MPVEYTNRKGDVYYLHEGKTRTGEPQYYFSRESARVPVDKLPAGYEIYESPEAGQVYLRRLRPVIITAAEREIVRDGLRRHAELKYALVDVQQDSLVIYLPSIDPAGLELLVQGRFMSPEKKRDLIHSSILRSPYTKMMRFVLMDKAKRLFRAERWCFRGSIDNWIFLDGPADLSTLADEYLKHLSGPSFFELM